MQNYRRIQKSDVIFIKCIMLFGMVGIGRYGKMVGGQGFGNDNADILVKLKLGKLESLKYLQMTDCSTALHFYC
jgi:hypothetical protein